MNENGTGKGVAKEGKGTAEDRKAGAKSELDGDIDIYDIALVHSHYDKSILGLHFLWIKLKIYISVLLKLRIQINEISF